MRARVTTFERESPDANALAILLSNSWGEDLSRMASNGANAKIIQTARRWLERIRFTGESDSFTWFTERDFPVLIAGLGPAEGVEPATWRRIGGRLAIEGRRLGVRNLTVWLPDFGTESSVAEKTVRALTIGFAEGSLLPRPTATPPGPLEVTDLRLCVPPSLYPKTIEKNASRGLAIGKILNDVRQLANRSGGEIGPEELAEEAMRFAKRHGLLCEIWDHRRLQKENCGAFLAVGRGSHRPPCLIHLRYGGSKRSTAPAVIVGKTITFDTGGISLKPGKGMEWMKFDKSGGMATLALMGIVGSVLKPDRPVVGLLAAAENMPGGGATRPGDVVRARNGKSIEIVNTDAEGRLVLADALDIAGQYGPACVIDLATLTGAANIALGRPYSAILSNNPKLCETLREAGEATGDRVWPLPLHPDYRALLKTPFADLKNIGDGSAGTIIGGIFLEYFVPSGVPWAHIDLTSAWEEQDKPHRAAGATLFGAALLSQWLENGGPSQLNR